MYAYGRIFQTQNQMLQCTNNATTVNATTVNATTVNAITVNAITVNAITVNATKPTPRGSGMLDHANDGVH